MNLINKNDVFDAGIQIFEIGCADCGFVRNSVQPKKEHPSNAIGIQCRRCSSLIWMNGRYGPMRKGWGDYDDDGKTAAKQSIETYRTWAAKVDAELFAQLPVCPCCGAHDYEIFNVMKQIPCPSCGSLKVDISSVKDVTNKHCSEDVWWFGPLRV